MTDLVLRVKECIAVSSQGTILVGTITSGSVRTGQMVTISSPSHAAQAVVEGVEVEHGKLDFARAGDAVGVLVKPFDLNYSQMALPAKRATSTLTSR